VLAYQGAEAPGDSGGSLDDEQQGRAVGVDTAGAEGYASRAATRVPVPIDPCRSTRADRPVPIDPCRSTQRTGVAVESLVGDGAAARVGLAKVR
jgi:hypothetical protein